MRKAAIITNLKKDRDLSVTGSLVAELEKKCWEIHYSSDLAVALGEKKQIAADEKYDVCFVIGGDGTVLSAVNRYPDFTFIGINLGRMGFLTEVETDEIAHCVQKITRGECYTEERMMINVSAGDMSVDALNEVSIRHRIASGIGEFKVFVNEVFLAHYEADGIIVSTPTGSTAYNLSAGGPILSPACEGMIIQSICSHSMNSRGVVVSADEDITVMFDNDESHIMADGDILETDTGAVRIKKSEKTVKLMHLYNYNFYNSLFEKIKQPNYLRGGLS